MSVSRCSLPILVWLALLAGAAGALPADGGGPVQFFMQELLFHPRSDGVTLALQPAEPAVLQVTYGPVDGHSLTTAARTLRAGELARFELDGLWPDGEFVYQVAARRPSEPGFRLRAPEGFRTTRSPGSTFRFAVAADTHAYAIWSKDACGATPGNTTDWLTLVNSLEHFRDDDVYDFVVAGSDSAMTRCGGGCVACEVDAQPVSAGDVESLLDARLRYRQVFSPEVFGMFGKRRPLLYVFGDHDGEQGWGGSCNLSPDVLAWSTQARRELLPNPFDVYGGAPSGRNYAMTSGDLLIVVLDPLSQTSGAPLGPGDFSLGPRQLEWFEQTLAGSDATFKIVMAEHLLGGISSPDLECWKGRGGIRSTDDGLPTGNFLGEQFLVHELMKAHGAQLFLSFHDHVVAVGEKPGADGLGEGVVYAIGGRASGVGNPWSNQAWYRQAMDYDLDGVPEYDTGLSGTKQPGFFEVTVHGDERLELRYLRSSPLPALDGEVLVQFEIAPGGGLLSLGGAPVR